tara:strand:- start:2458 stop:4443 length:1986 start_codon:yes stop_codon:yes gene_type:complete
MAYIPPKKAMMNLDINAPTEGGFESVGQSLLAQKKADAASRSSSSAKNMKIVEGLGLLAFGSSLYRGQAKKRAGELTNSKALSLAKTDNEAKNLKLVGVLKQNIGNQTADEFIANPESMSQLSATGMGDFINSIGEANMGKDGWAKESAVNKERITTTATESLIRNWLTVEEGSDKTRLDTVFDNAAKHGSIFNPNGTLSEEDVLTKLLQLTQGELTADITRIYNNADAQFNESAPLLRGVGRSLRNVFSSWKQGDEREEEKNPQHISLFKTASEDNILDADHRKMMLMAANINTTIVPIVQNAVSVNSTENYLSRVIAAKSGDGSKAGAALNALERIKIKEQEIDDNYDLGYYVSPIALRDSIEHMLEEMSDTVYDEKSGKFTEPADGGLPNLAKLDAASLYMRLSDPKQIEFRKQFYMSSAHSLALKAGFESGSDSYREEVNRIVEEFSTEIIKTENVEQLAKIAMLTTLEIGAEKKQGKFPSFDALTYNSGKMQALIRPVFEVKNNKYVPSAGWRELEDQQKENIVFLELNNILSSSASDADKEQLSQSLFNDLGRKLTDVGNSQEEFIRAFDEWLPDWNAQTSNFASLQKISTRNDSVAAQQLAIRLFGASGRADNIANRFTVGGTDYDRTELSINEKRQQRQQAMLTRGGRGRGFL